jgi:hypothetical protein
VTEQVYRSKRASSRKMSEYYGLISFLASLAAICTAVWAALRFIISPLFRKHFQPKLRLIDSFLPGSQGESSGGELHIFIENTGWRAAKDIVVELSVFRPTDISVGHGLFFDTKIGHIESEPKIEVFAPMPSPLVFRYRLESNVFVNPIPDGPLPIARLIRAISPKDTAEKLDIDIMWTTSCLDVRPTAGYITKKGTELRSEIIAKLPSAERQKIPQGGVPESSEKDRE